MVAPAVEADGAFDGEPRVFQQYQKHGPVEY